jgi:hypothetical protein
MPEFGRRFPFASGDPRQGVMGTMSVDFMVIGRLSSILPKES